LSGSIPVEFGQLVNLRNLALDHNQLSGNIPGTFSALTKLVNLRLSYNKLFGKLPSQLGGLINLVELQVDHNRFNGDVPASLTQLIHLSVGTAPSEYGLDLGYNYFKTPASPQTLANFLAVKDPDWAATQNKFIDCTAVVEIPEAECEALTALYTDTNGDQWTYTTNWFTNLQPSSWYGVTVSNGHVNSLSLASNNLTGVLPSQLGNLMELELLDLHSNNLTGSLPNELRNLSRLKYVFLNDNQISGGLPVDLEMLNKLEELNLSQNQLTGNIPPELGNMAALKSLSLGKNQLNGSLPVELGNLSTLDKFEASKNQLSGLIPTEFGQLVNLRTLALDHNQLSGAIPSGLSNLTQLIYLDLSANQLSGEIPGSMVNMLKLENLSLSNNQLLGTLPHGVGDLTSLVTLRVAHNRLYGDVPASLTKLSHLKVGAAPSDYGLDLGYNYFKTPASPQALSNFLAVKDPDWAATQSNSVDCSKVVEIPQTECEALSVFYLSTNGVDWAKKTNWLNNLQPSSWYGVKVSSGHVNALELSANQLSGGIPASLGSLTHLENLDLSDNRLSGDVPAELSGLNALTTLDLGHNYLNHPAVPQSLAAFLAALDPDWEITQAKFIPELSGTQPLMTPAGSADLSLTVTGSGFAAVSKVRWNGTDLATTYISASELKALIPAAKMIAPGSAALTVYNPVPGGGTSAALAFVIYTVGESGSSTLLDPVSPSLLTVNGADPAHQTSINVPAGAVSSSTQLTFMEEPAGAAGQPSGFAFGGRHFSLTAYVDGAAQPHFTFQQPVRLTLTYPANLPDFLADGLELRYWNSEAGKWQTDGITLIGLDKTKHQAVVEITHLSEFELLYRAKQLMLPVINN
jgi:Leucine-rich repeat (LRR) protein